jgi:hypothetical protein
VNRRYTWNGAKAAEEGAAVVEGEEIKLFNENSAVALTLHGKQHGGARE